MRSGLWYLSCVCIVLAAQAVDAAGILRPQVVPASDVARCIKSLPRYAGFGYNGLEFYRGKLYAGCNFGLLEFKNGQLTQLLQFDRLDSDVEGPFLDKAHQMLWIWRADQFIRFDGTNWRSTQIPSPKGKPYITSGDVLEGFRGVSGIRDFWLEGAGGVWQWTVRDDLAGWVEQPSPVDKNHFGPPDVFRVAPLGNDISYVIRYRAGEGDAIQVLHDGNWRTITNVDTKFVSERAASVGDAVYVQTTSGGLVKVTSKTISTVNTPGICETIAVTSSNKLVASFRGAGIYELKESWQKRFPAPAIDTGEHWTFLAEGQGITAFATVAMPQLDAKGNPAPYSGKTALWISDAGGLRTVPMADSRRR